MPFKDSRWKVTMGPGLGSPLVALDFGQEYEGELVCPWRQQRQRGIPARGSFGINYGRGGVENDFSITTIEQHADHEAAMKWCLDFQLLLNDWSGLTDVLKVEILGVDGHYELASATINDAVARLRVTGTALTTTEWQFGGCGWSFVPPP
jgi:hypothetical protein